MSIKLPDPDAPKVQWTLECFNGNLAFAISFFIFYFVSIVRNREDIDPMHRGKKFGIPYKDSMYLLVIIGFVVAAILL